MLLFISTSLTKLDYSRSPLYNRFTSGWFFQKIFSFSTACIYFCGQPVVSFMAYRWLVKQTTFCSPSSRWFFKQTHHRNPASIGLVKETPPRHTASINFFNQLVFRYPAKHYFFNQLPLSHPARSQFFKELPARCSSKSTINTKNIFF